MGRPQYLMSCDGAEVRGVAELIADKGYHSRDTRCGIIRCSSWLWDACRKMASCARRRQSRDWRAA